MARYVDGFVIPIPNKNVKAYKTMATKASKVWLDHGALQYVEAVGEDMAIKGMVGFPKIAGCKKGETVVFAWIVYKSRAHRDAVNAKVMKDKRLIAMMNPKNPPFDFKRMAYGGFETLVDK